MFNTKLFNKKLFNKKFDATKFFGTIFWNFRFLIFATYLWVKMRDEMIHGSKKIWINLKSIRARFVQLIFQVFQFDYKRTFISFTRILSFRTKNIFSKFSKLEFCLKIVAKIFQKSIPCCARIGIRTSGTVGKNIGSATSIIWVVWRCISRLERIKFNS